MSPEESAVAFLQLAGSGEVRAAFEKFIAPDFIHHNQYFKGDRESLQAAMEAAHRNSPNRAIEVKRAFVDGDTVITHSRVVRKDPAQPDVAAVHIFRFENGLVAELWDLGQLIEKESPNENGVF